MYGIIVHSAALGQLIEEVAVAAVAVTLGVRERSPLQGNGSR